MTLSLFWVQRRRAQCVFFAFAGSVRGQLTQKATMQLMFSHQRSVASTLLQGRRSTTHTRQRLLGSSGSGSNGARLLPTCAARSRKTAAGNTSPESSLDSKEDEEGAAETAAAPPPLVRSSRRAPPASAARGRRGAAALRTVASPLQSLKDKGVLAVDENG